MVARWVERVVDFVVDLVAGVVGFLVFAWWGLVGLIVAAWWRLVGLWLYVVTFGRWQTLRDALAATMVEVTEGRRALETLEWRVNEFMRCVEDQTDVVFRDGVAPPRQTTMGEVEFNLTPEEAEGMSQKHKSEMVRRGLYTVPGEEDAGVPHLSNHRPLYPPPVMDSAEEDGPTGNTATSY